MSKYFPFKEKDFIRDFLISFIIHYPLSFTVISLVCASIRFLDGSALNFFYSFFLYFLIVLAFSIRCRKYLNEYELGLYEYLNEQKFAHFCGDPTTIDKSNMSSVESAFKDLITKNQKRNEIALSSFGGTLLFFGPWFNALFV